VNSLYQLIGIRVDAGGREILHIPELEFSSGRFIAIGGPNGAGKSTLLSVMSGLRQHFSGRCIFNGRDVRAWPRKEFARQVAVVHQTRPVSFPFTVGDIVLMGRTPHARYWLETPEDLQALESALEQTDAAGLRGREFRTLSGGERQRVLLASALAQDPRVLLLDEPTNCLDLHHQVQFYKLLANLRDKGVLVISVTHDLNLAASYADRLLILHGGRRVADGKPEQVITADVMREIFQVEAEFSYNDAGKLWMRYGG
jgi:iron complex transport system ATP-binding protein